VDDLFSILAFIFVILSLLGGRSAGKGRGRPAPRREGTVRGQAPAPAPSPVPDTGHTPAGTPAAAGAGWDSSPASDMIPDDLWEILTGERRQRPPVVVEEPNWPADAEGGWQEVDREWPLADEGSADEEALVPAGRPAAEAGSLEVGEPMIVSLEELPPPPEERHARFRARLEAVRATRQRARPRGPRLPLSLSDRTALQRAVILREVLGPPKGLE
jgi:hypothetical protein